mgnify:CR=1 FL=1
MVVKKIADNQYTYDLYVDGVLTWEAVAPNDLGTNKTDIFKIGIDASKVVGTQSVLNVDLDSIYILLVK